MGVHFSAGFHRAKDPTLPSNMKFLLVIAFIGSAKAIETVGLHQQTPVQYGSQIGPVLYGALGEGGLVSESRTLPDEAGPKMSALPTSGLATVPKTLKPAQPLVYSPNPYVYIPAIGQVAKPEETVGNVEPRTVPEGLKPVATNPFVYTASPYVYAQSMNPVHPVQIKPIVPHGFAYSFTVGNENVPAQPKADAWKENYGHPSYWKLIQKHHLTADRKC